MTKPDDKPKAVLKRLKDPVYQGGDTRERWETHYYKGGRIVTRHWKDGRHIVVRGCATCDCLVAGHDHNWPGHGYSCRARPETARREDNKSWCHGIGPCPDWQGDIGVCEKHGEYLKKEGCIDCQLEQMEESNG